MVLAGPGIKAGSEFDLIASNVDTMPTILGLAGVATPPSMDGRSYAHLLLRGSDGGIDPAAPAPARALLAEQGTAAEWRTEQLIEYGGGGPVVRYEHLEDIHNNTFRCLRVVDKTAAAGESNVKLCEVSQQATRIDFHVFYQLLTFMSHSLSAGRIGTSHLQTD